MIREVIQKPEWVTVKYLLNMSISSNNKKKLQIMKIYTIWMNKYNIGSHINIYADASNTYKWDISAIIQQTEISGKFSENCSIYTIHSMSPITSLIKSNNDNIIIINIQ